MVTMEQAKKGIRAYMEHEVADKIGGLRKWAVIVATEPIVMELERMVGEHKDVLVRSGYLTEDMMVNDDRFFDELMKVAREKGSVTEHFPVVGDVTFSDHDVMVLHQYVG